MRERCLWRFKCNMCAYSLVEVYQFEAGCRGRTGIFFRLRAFTPSRSLAMSSSDADSIDVDADA